MSNASQVKGQNGLSDQQAQRIPGPNEQVGHTDRFEGDNRILTQLLAIDSEA
jgi:hypothetical protein